MHSDSPAHSDQADLKLDVLVPAFLQENAHINLSSIRDEAGVREKHIRDSLVAEPILREKLADNLTDARILDLGTGGGFPLLPLAAVFPQARFFGLDSVAKKLAAVTRIAAVSGIQNVTLVNGRAEELGRDPKYREQFDAVTARAVAKFPVMLEYASPFIKPRGLLICYRGPEESADDLLLASALNLKFREKWEYELSGGEQRTLWIFEKNGMLSKKYPRAVGIPKSKPLSVEDF